MFWIELEDSTDLGTRRFVHIWSPFVWTLCSGENFTFGPFMPESSMFGTFPGTSQTIQDYPSLASLKYLKDAGTPLIIFFPTTKC